jgi:hypothetical protein
MTQFYHFYLVLADWFLYDRATRDLKPESTDLVLLVGVKGFNKVFF